MVPKNPLDIFRFLRDDIAWGEEEMNRPVLITTDNGTFVVKSISHDENRNVVLDTERA